MKEFKKCTKCGIKKSLNMFSNDSRTKDGKQFHCKSCKKTGLREVRSSGREGINVKLSDQYRTELYLSLKQDRTRGYALERLGCSVAEFKKHLESMWHPCPETGIEMNWENWNYGGWHLDHIKPLCNFDLTDPEQVKAACHYTNIQPLWLKENIQKGTTRTKLHKIKRS